MHLKHIFSDTNYLHYGKWTSDNCSDPKKLFESIVYKSENVIDNGYFIDFEDYVDYFEDYVEDIGSTYGIYWYYIDVVGLVDAWWYGRCITLLTNTGIKKIELTLLVNSTIFIHTPGMLWERDGGQRIQKKDIEQGNTYNIALDYEYHQLLDVDYGGVSCKKEKEYRKDLCTAKMKDNIRKIYVPKKHWKRK